MFPQFDPTVGIFFSFFKPTWGTDFKNIQYEVTGKTTFENIKFNCLVETKKADAFIADIIERTDGRSAPRMIGEEYLPLAEK